MAASLAFGVCEAAVAQVRGPPAAAAAQSIGDIARQEDLSQRADALQQKLSRRQDSQAAQMLTQVRNLLAKLRASNLSDTELDGVEATLARLESAAG